MGFLGVFCSRRIIQVSAREIVVFWLDFGCGGCSVKGGSVKEETGFRVFSGLGGVESVSGKWNSWWGKFKRRGWRACPFRQFPNDCSYDISVRDRP
jgi:hypothetical protein